MEAAASRSCCYGGLPASLNWRYGQQHPDGDVGRRLRRLRPGRRVRLGRLLECSDCGQVWHLDGDEAFVRIVPPGRADLLARWDRGPLTLAPAQIDGLKAIGASPLDPYGVMSGRAEVPCLAVVGGGEAVELSVVRFQKIPPIESGMEKIRLVDEIAEIRPSAYALPAEVRFAAARAGELAMGFAPTAVRGPKGQEFILNGPNDFFVEPGVCARDVVLSRRRVDRNMSGVFVSRPIERITFFIADWAEELRCLYLSR